MNELIAEQGKAWTAAREHLAPLMVGVENAPALLDYARAFEIVCTNEINCALATSGSQAPESEPEALEAKGEGIEAKASSDASESSRSRKRKPALPEGATLPGGATPPGEAATP